jgi:hypothetical protein
MNILTAIFKKVLFNNCSYVAAKRAGRIKIIRNQKVTGTSLVIEKVAGTKHAIKNN